MTLTPNNNVFGNGKVSMTRNIIIVYSMKNVSVLEVTFLRIDDKETSRNRGWSQTIIAVLTLSESLFNSGGKSGWIDWDRRGWVDQYVLILLFQS